MTSNPWSYNAQGYAMVPDLQTPDTGNAVPSAGSYPAMPNDYGLGDQTGAIQGSAANPNYQNQPLTVTVPDTASRGFNPWSLTGESNARGK